jgi:hypothetical protein
MAVSDDDRRVELGDDDYAVLPDQTADDTDVGWGEAPPKRRPGTASADDVDYFYELPPHWA